MTHKAIFLITGVVHGEQDRVGCCPARSSAVVNTIFVPETDVWCETSGQMTEGLLELFFPNFRAPLRDVSTQAVHNNVCKSPSGFLYSQGFLHVLARFTSMLPIAASVALEG